MAAASASASLQAAFQAAQSSSISASLASASQSASVAAASASASLQSAFQAAQSSSVAASIAAASASAASAAEAAGAAASSSLASSLAAYSSSLAAAAATATSTLSSTAGAAPTAGTASLPSPWIGAGAGGAFINIAEGTTGRALTGGQTAFPDNSYAKCLQWCSDNGFSICGMEYASECYGSNVLSNGAALSKTSSNTPMPCSGDPSSMCGGPAMLTLFVTPRAINSLNADLTAPLNGAATGATGAVGGATSTVSSAAGQATGNAGTVPSPWQLVGGSVAEGTSGRALTGGSTSASDMTVEKCMNWCASQGYTLCGLEYASECYGGSVLSNGAALSKTSTNSFMPCSGNPSQNCGGSAFLSLYAVPQAISSLNADLNSQVGAATSTATGAAAGATGATGTGTGSTGSGSGSGAASGNAAAANVPAPWKYAGAIQEGINGRALTGGSTSASDMTYEKCLAWCTANNYALCGMEYSSECYGA